MNRDKDLRTYQRAECAVFRKTAEEFGGLSNMAPGFPVRINGVRILTVEALYQACRFPHLPEVQRKIIEQTSPMTAKMVGKPYRGDSRPDWDRVRVKIMRWVLRLKLAMHWTQFSALLLSTGERPIVEDSRKDDFWGAMPSGPNTLVGMNVLGRLLMELREEIKQGAELRHVTPPAITDLLLFGEAIGAVDFRSDKSQPYVSDTPVTALAAHELSQSLFDDSTHELPETTLPEADRALEAKPIEALLARVEPYERYKDTGLPWLGSCPDHWALRRTKILFQERVQKGYPNEPLLAATQTKGVVRKEDYGTRTVTAQKDLHLLKLVEPGDYVISLRSFQGGIEVAHYRGIISPAYTVLKPSKEASSGYYSYFFKSKQFIDSLSLFVTGIREGQNIDYERLSRVEMPLPAQEEQAAIVRFLNHTNRKIDGFIRAKRKVVALLNEQKQVIVHRAVTRGLEDGVPLKPSGVSHLGEIPRHWEVKRIKYLLREVDSRSVTGKEPLLSMRMHHGLVIFAEHFTRPPQAATLVGFKVVKPRQFVVNRMQAGNGVIFPSCLDITGLVSPDYAVFEPITDINVDYLGELFRTGAMRVKFRSESKGLGTGTSGFMRLYNDRFGAIHIALPPRAEQDSILKRLETELSSLNLAMGRVEREIGLMHEFRTRLTADIVTGKLDVREAAARLPDLIDEGASEIVVDEVLDEIETEES